MFTVILNASDRSAPMPLDPERLRELGEKAAGLSKRFDELMERQKINDAAEDEDDENEDCDLLDPTEEARKATPGSDLANPEFENPWWS
jgi:hypothetical protein